jgi:tetratricopeptide (TPR) repeat protein
LDLFSIIFLVVGVPLTILTAIYAHAMYLYARGDIAQQKGELEHSEKRFLKAVHSWNPIGRGMACAALGRVYLKMNRPDDAIAQLRSALTLTKMPSAIMAAYQLYADTALHADLAQDPKDLLREGQRLLDATRMPGTLKAMLYAQFAHAWSTLGDFEMAESLGSIALEKDRLNPSALYVKAWLSLQAGRIEEAENLFRTLTASGPKDQRPLGHYGLATAAFYSGRLAEADELYGKTIDNGSVLIEPFARARRAITRSINGQPEASENLRKSEAVLDDLFSRGVLGRNSGARWLVAMARAYVEKNSSAARIALTMAPEAEKPEASRLAAALTGETVQSSWIPMPPKA